MKFPIRPAKSCILNCQRHILAEQANLHLKFPSAWSRTGSGSPGWKFFWKPVSENSAIREIFCMNGKVNMKACRAYMFSRMPAAVRLLSTAGGIALLPRRASQMPAARRFEAIGTQGTRLFHPAKPSQTAGFVQRSSPMKPGNPRLTPCLTCTTFNAHIFTKTLILLAINEVVLPHGIEP